MVGYSNSLDNGLEIGGRLAIFVSDDANRSYNPGESFVTIGGGFGTIAMGNHVTAVHATLPFPLLTPDSPHWGHHGMFAALELDNGPGLWPFFGTTPNGITYSTPTMSGLVARVTYAPHTEANQSNQITDAVDDENNAENYMAAAVSYSSSMGGMDIGLGVGMQTAEDDMVDSIAATATLGFGPATVAVGWHDMAMATTPRTASPSVPSTRSARSRRPLVTAKWRPRTAKTKAFSWSAAATTSVAASARLLST